MIFAVGIVQNRDWKGCDARQKLERRPKGGTDEEARGWKWHRISQEMAGGAF